jgi:sugar porter (SP) family MFS transporter
MLVMVEGLLITGGICMAYWVDFAFYWLDPTSRMPNLTMEQLQQYPHRSASWRIPIAWQILLCIPTFVTIWMPESPRWLLLKCHEEEARKVMASLDETTVDDPEVSAKVKEIQLSLDASNRRSVADVFKQGKEKNFHRAFLGIISQMFQQISGINLITYYAATIYENSIGMSPLISRIVAACNGTEYFAASLVAIWTIELFGRRKLMIFGAVGMSISMAVLAACTSPAATDPLPDGTSQNKAPGYVAAVFLFIFNTFFAIGWLGMTWLYPAEITPLSIRAAANGLSTASNWTFNFLVVLITPIAFANIGYQTYIIFAVLNAGIAIFSFLSFPETSGRSLEEMSMIFEHASVWNLYDVVRIEQRTPRRYDKKGRPVSDEEIFVEVGAVRSDADEGEKGKASLSNVHSPLSVDTRDASP